MGDGIKSLMWKINFNNYRLLSEFKSNGGDPMLNVEGIDKKTKQSLILYLKARITTIAIFNELLNQKQKNSPHANAKRASLMLVRDKKKRDIVYYRLASYELALMELGVDFYDDVLEFFVDKTRFSEISPYADIEEFLLFFAEFKGNRNLYNKLREIFSQRCVIAYDSIKHLLTPQN